MVYFPLRLFFCLASIRHYYIAAEDVTWNYAPSGHNLLSQCPSRSRLGIVSGIGEIRGRDQLARAERGRVF